MVERNTATQNLTKGVDNLKSVLIPVGEDSGMNYRGRQDQAL
jgi:hypothetical protein